jgi:hypothetical protein
VPGTDDDVPAKTLPTAGQRSGHQVSVLPSVVIEVEHPGSDSHFSFRQARARLRDLLIVAVRINYAGITAGWLRPLVPDVHSASRSWACWNAQRPWPPPSHAILPSSLPAPPPSPHQIGPAPIP